MSRKYHEDLAKELGLEIIYSPTVDSLLDQINKIAADMDPGDYNTMTADESVTCDRDEGWLSAILHVLSVCAQNPGRKRWVLGFCETVGYSEVHLFAVDSVRQATSRLRKKAVELRQMKAA